MYNNIHLDNTLHWDVPPIYRSIQEPFTLGISNTSNLNEFEFIHDQNINVLRALKMINFNFDQLIDWMNGLTSFSNLSRLQDLQGFKIFVFCPDSQGEQWAYFS